MAVVERDIQNHREASRLLPSTPGGRETGSATGSVIRAVDCRVGRFVEPSVWEAMVTDSTAPRASSTLVCAALTAPPALSAPRPSALWSSSTEERSRTSSGSQVRPSREEITARVRRIEVPRSISPV
ncbi:hypothetical protein ACSL103130_08720 [Actinomyces slackii]